MYASLGEYEERLGMFKPIERILFFFKTKVVRPRLFLDYPGFTLIKELSPEE